MRINRLAALLAAIAVAAVIAPAAQAQSACCYPERAQAIEISADDRFVYATSDVTLAMRRDPATGGLDLVDVERSAGGGLALSPDQRHLYVGEEIFERDPATGTLTLVGRHGGGGFSHVGSVSDYMEFADDRTLYMSGPRGVLTIFDRDPASGLLTPRREIAVETAPNSGGELAMAPDGRWLYLAGTGPDGGAITAFRVLPGGDLEIVPEAGCRCGADPRIEMAPDGGRVAIGPGRMIATLQRDAAGALHGRGDEQLWLSEGNFVFTPDGASLFAADGDGDQLLEYDNAGEGLTRRASYDRADGIERMPSAVALSHDARHVYVGAGAELSMPSTITVFERRGPGDLVLSSTFAPPLVDGRPIGGPPPSVTINDGAEYTDDPEVKLTFAGLGWKDDVLEISNDGGFVPMMSVHHQPSYVHSWTLDSTGPDVLPRTVYVRVRGRGRHETLVDDIILDETAPLVSARRAGRKLTVKARDRVSGVTHIQVTRNPRKPGAWVRYRRRTALPGGRGAIRVRARDRARNKSRWATAR